MQLPRRLENRGGDDLPSDTAATFHRPPQFYRSREDPSGAVLLGEGLDLLVRQLRGDLAHVDLALLGLGLLHLHFILCQE